VILNRSNAFELHSNLGQNITILGEDFRDFTQYCDSNAGKYLKIVYDRSHPNSE